MVIARSTDNVADAPAPDAHCGCRHGVGLKITNMSRFWTWVRCGCGNDDGPSPGAGHSRHPPGSRGSADSTEIVEAHSRRGEAGSPATRSGWRPIDETMHRAIDGQASYGGGPHPVRTGRTSLHLTARFSGHPSPQTLRAWSWRVNEVVTCACDGGSAPRIDEEGGGVVRTRCRVRGRGGPAGGSSRHIPSLQIARNAHGGSPVERHRLALAH